jgi:hypothetical protein
MLAERRRSRRGGGCGHGGSYRACRNPTLIDELPYAAELLLEAPTDLRARVYAAFDVHALYRAEMNQATITAKVTDATPQLTQALLDDLRTDHDTHGPARTNPAISAVAVVFTLQDSVPLLA